MKRVIKFRAYTEISNEVLGMKYDVPHDYNDTVMQFTGLLDRHGKEIYEGDIVKYEVWKRFHGDMSEHTSAVEFNEKWAGWWPMVGHTVVDDGYYNWEVENIEIIGNIYESPELIKTT